ncbi:DNA repair exonuclease [Candidatus Woesearchaeota archaeon]|nr:DNA repair exonuclease [Candidatus Woesearchaeota archaeon]
MADVHLGSWREPKLRELGTKAFVNAVSKCISEKVDFVLISGDLFNTSLPPIESLKTAVTQLKRLKLKGIPVYTIAGSHDFSPSGKTMLDVLEEAELVVDVFKGGVMEGRLNLEFTVDPKTGAKIAGMIGKKGMLEKKHYEELITSNLEQEHGFKIFMFHTALTELKPAEMQQMESAPVSLLPKGFDYYAGGHVHIVKEASLDGYKNVVYPGPLFPNSFSELEKLKNGGFYIHADGQSHYVPVRMCGVTSIQLDCSGRSPIQVSEYILDAISDEEVNDSIVLLRLWGTLETGKPSEIQYSRIAQLAQEKGAYLFMKNTARLASKEFEEIKVEAETAEEAEMLAISEHTGQVTSIGLTPDDEKHLIIQLMTALDSEKDEGEKQADYESRIVAEADRIFENVK